MTLYDHVRLHSKQSGSRLLVLLFIASHLDAGEQPSQKQLADDSRMSVRQVTRIVDALELSGELKVDRSGGHTSHRYGIPTVESDNVDKMSTLHKRQHGRFTSERRGDGVSETDSTNVDKMSTLSDSTTLTRCHDNMATLPPNVDNPSTSNVDKLSGTPLAPLSAETTKRKKSQAAPETAAESAADATDWGEIGRERGLMLDALKSILGAIPAPQAERAACNWLLKNRDKLNATTADFIECLREQADEVESGSGRRKVSWMTVKGEFPAWQLRSRGGVKNVERNQPRRQDNGSRADTYHRYDYSGLEGAAGEGARRPDSEVPADEWVATPSTGRPTGDDRRLARSSRH